MFDASGLTMNMDLSHCIEDIHGSGKSGLLSITVANGKTLLKLFFRDGEVYHITCGNLKGTACLAQLTGIDFADYHFMPDVVLPVSDGGLPPFSELLRMLNPRRNQSETPDKPTSGNNRPFRSLSVLQENLKVILMKQIGPAGAVAVTRIMAQKWKATATPPSREDFLRLIDLLKEQVENEADRGEFVKEARALLS
jgi:hypothetical protein